MKVMIKRAKAIAIMTFFRIKRGLLMEIKAQNPIKPIVKTARVEVVS